LLREPLGGLPRAERLERAAHLDDLDGLLDRDRPHPRAAIRQSLDEALVREVDERKAHGGAARAELLAEVRLDEPLVGHVAAREDLVPDARDELVVDRRLAHVTTVPDASAAECSGRARSP